MTAYRERVAADWSHWNFMAWTSRCLPEGVQEWFPGDQESFDIRFLEDLLVRLGDDNELLAQLGYLYTRVGRYRDGLAVDRRLVALRPRDPIAYYNLACSHSRLKQFGRAFTAIRRAIELGYRDLEHMQADPDLENLRKDPRWNDLLAVMKS
jgi:tetratricopeptide (TPR) repeat protein